MSDTAINAESTNSNAETKNKDQSPKGPETDPNLVGRPSSIIWIYLVFGLVVVLAAGLGKAQSTAIMVRLREIWAKVLGR